MTRRTRSFDDVVRRGRHPRGRQRPRADAVDRHRRPDPPARRPDQPERSRVHPRPGPHGRRRRVDRRLDCARRRPGAPPRRRGHADLRRATCTRCRSSPTWPASAARSSSPGWDVAAKEAIAAEADVAAIRAELGRRHGRRRAARAGVRRPHRDHRAHRPVDHATRPRRRPTPRCGPAPGASSPRPAWPRATPGCGSGARVAPRRARPGFNGTYTLVEVEHTFDGRLGYQTRFRAERPGLGGAP